MSGPSVAPYIIPVGAFLALAFWLAMIFWADRHPVKGGASDRVPGTRAIADWQVEMGVPPQRTAVEEAQGQEAPQVPAQSTPDRERISRRT